MSSRDITNILSKTERTIILSKTEGNKCNIVHCKIEEYSENAVGFLAEHYLMYLYYFKENDNDILYSKKFFLKTIPHCNETQKSYIKNMGVFEKESLMYKNLIRKFLKLTSNRFAPMYYYSKFDQCIVLEDMSDLNFKVCKEDYLDDNKCNSALTAIARLHAASIIFEEIRSTEENPFRINEHFIKEVAETTFSFQSGHVRNLWCNSATNCLENLSKFFTDNSAVAGKIKEYVFSEEGLRKFLRPSEKYRNTVCHDDLWRNNMMFNEINTCVLVDFQLTRYTPPVFDVLLLLYINVESNYLKANFDFFLNMYYGYLKYELSNKDLDIEKIIPKTDFFASVEEYRLPALVESGLYGTNVYLSKDMSNLVTSSTEIFEEFTFKNRSPFIIKEFQTNDNFRLRFSNVLKPLYEMFEEM